MDVRKKKHGHPYSMSKKNRIVKKQKKKQTKAMPTTSPQMSTIWPCQPVQMGRTSMLDNPRSNDFNLVCLRMQPWLPKTTFACSFACLGVWRATIGVKPMLLRIHHFVVDLLHLVRHRKSEIISLLRVIDHIEQATELTVFIRSSIKSLGAILNRGKTVPWLRGVRVFLTAPTILQDEANNKFETAHHVSCVTATIFTYK